MLSADVAGRVVNAELRATMVVRGVSKFCPPFPAKEQERQCHANDTRTWELIQGEVMNAARFYSKEIHNSADVI